MEVKYDIMGQARGRKERKMIPTKAGAANVVQAPVFSDIELRKVYFVRGVPPRDVHFRNPFVIRDPPSSGWSTVLVMPARNDKCSILCPHTLRSYKVPVDCGELLGTDKISITPEVAKSLMDKIERNMEMFPGLGETLPVEQALSLLRVRKPRPQMAQAKPKSRRPMRAG